MISLWSEHHTVFDTRNATRTSSTIEKNRAALRKGKGRGYMADKLRFGIIGCGRVHQSM